MNSDHSKKFRPLNRMSTVTQRHALLDRLLEKCSRPPLDRQLDARFRLISCFWAHQFFFDLN